MQALFAEAAARKKKLPTGYVNGFLQRNEPTFTSSDSDSDENTTEYEQQFVYREMQRYHSKPPVIVNDDDYDRLSDVDGGESTRSFARDIYSRFNFNSTFLKPDLPIDSFKKKILEVVNINNVTVIQGDTGCGKSTQVPQFILDECRAKNAWCSIVVTQPRKIAAINVARRVCEERGWALGDVCGYQIGLEKKCSNNSLITYMTTGVLLQKLILAKHLHQFSHILIDEVHERNEELDFLLLVIRKFLFTNSPRTKVILMSATIVAKDFAYYFRGRNVHGELMAPIITIDKKNVYKKHISYVDQLSGIKKLPLYDKNNAEISQSLWEVFMFILMAFDKVDREDPGTHKKIIGSVLVFLPGLRQIEDANQLLTKFNRPEDGSIQWEVIPLHSTLPNDEQAKVFKKPMPGCRKVILSTNIAESSITVPDIYYVVDFCLTKVLTVDPITNYSSLQLEWASHMNCDQRAGRVGRVFDGRVYRLVPSAFYEECMDAQTVPEILRAPLDGVVLKAKMLNFQDTPKQILALALNPPNLKNIEMTIWNLKEVGGLLQTCRGIKSNSDGDITFLGEIMAALPLDVHLSKLIILGYMFSCLEEAIIIATGCSINNIFSIPFQQRFLAYKKLLMWSDRSCSDPITLLNLYNVWQSYSRDNTFENMRQQQNWCRQNFVSLKGMMEWRLLIEEIKVRLGNFNLVGGTRNVNLGVNERPTILKVITCGAFYPNFFTRSANCGQVDEREAVRTVGGRDPFRTVYLTGFNCSQPGPLYIKQIKKMFLEEARNEQNITVGFDGSCKIFVEFKRGMNQAEYSSVDIAGQNYLADIPGKIPIQIYECIRKRQLKYEYNLKMLSTEDAWKFAEKFGLTKTSALLKISNETKNCYSYVEYNPIPTMDMEFIKIHITTMIDAGHFWCQHVDEETQQLSCTIEKELNRHVLHPALESVFDGNKLQYENIYAARWRADNKFYRCKVNAVSGKMAYIIFVDYGNLEQVSVDQIYNLPPVPEFQTAPLAIECVLANVKPSLEKNLESVFSEEANVFFNNLTENKMLMAKIYSVVDDVISLELFYKGRDRIEYCMNKVLVEKGFAIAANESYLSEEDHMKRLSIQATDNPNQAALLFSSRKQTFGEFTSPDNYVDVLNLKGPFNSLEMNVHGVIVGAASKKIGIDKTSVNAVLLDHEPHDPNTRLLVAGSVSQSQSSNNLILRQTTLMPNIPGLAAIMAMLFCPTMEPKLLDDGTRVASLLCGMGYNQITGKPLYPMHDMNILLDTMVTVKEVDEVNNLRFLMNSCIKCMNNNYINENDLDKEQIRECQNNIKDALLRTLYQKREIVEKEFVRHDTEWNKSVTDAVILKTAMSEELDDIWPLLWFVKLNKSDPLTRNLGKNIEEVLSMAKGLIKYENITCQLCDIELIDIFDVRSHIMDLKHRENYKVYQEK